MDRLSQFELDLLVARQERQKYHPASLIAVRPTATGVVRVTADLCPQDCAHCGGHYLKSMKPLAEVAQGACPAWKSVLVSGACDQDGMVPILPHLATLKTLTPRYRMNLHPGWVLKPEAAQQLADVASVFSCDLVGDDQTLHEVYGLDCSVRDSLNSLLLLARYGRVVPHVCLGLSDQSDFNSELNAVRLLVDAGFREMVVIIFIPTVGTRLAQRNPPPPQGVATFLATLGLKYPQLRVTLGCMRPPGRYRQEVDRYAVLAGVNAIVQPTPGALQLADHLELVQEDFWECCAFYGAGYAG